MGDAIVVVVSEETSTISAAVGAKLWRSVTIAQLGEILAGETPRRVPDRATQTTTA